MYTEILTVFFHQERIDTILVRPLTVCVQDGFLTWITADGSSGAIQTSEIREYYMEKKA